MYIKYNNKEIQEICEHASVAKRKVGIHQRKVLARRLYQIESADNLAILQQSPGRCHPLRREREGQFSIDLISPLRLVFIPESEGVILIEELVTEVEILEIADTHQ